MRDPLIPRSRQVYFSFYDYPNESSLIFQVESGKIDLAHHGNWAKLALRELYELEEAVKAALQLVKLEETLIIVTADHSHSFTMNGYPTRGNDIFGFGNASNVITYETLSYANGPGFYHHRRNDSTNVNETWINVAEDPTRGDPFYRHFSPIYQPDETHGGEDVGVYAIGKKRNFPRKTKHQRYTKKNSEMRENVSAFRRLKNSNLDRWC